MLQISALECMHLSDTKILRIGIEVPLYKIR
jgi:hypothetical protein